MNNEAVKEVSRAKSSTESAWLENRLGDVSGVSGSRCAGEGAPMRKETML